MRLYTLFLLITFLFIAVGCDVRTIQFKSYTDMIKSELNQKGWIPSNVPTEIYDITVKWDIDTNDTWIQATLPKDSNFRSKLDTPLECSYRFLNRVFRYTRRSAREKGELYRLNKNTIIYLHGYRGESVLIYYIDEEILC